MEILKLLIQLFAEGDDTPTGDKAVESDVDTNNNDDDESDEDELDLESTNDDDDSNKDDQKDKSKNNGKQNAINAQRRLALKQQREKEIKDARDKAYMEGLKEGIGETNPWTNEKIEDEVDIEIYRTMKEMEKKGLDPIEDFAKYNAQKMKEQRRAEVEAKQKQAEKQQNVANEIADFDKKYGKGTAQKFLEDENFKNSKYLNYLGRLSLDEVYELYTSTQAETNAKAEEIAVQKEAIRMSSTGTPGNASGNVGSFLSDLMKDDKKFKEFQNNLINKY